MTKRIPTFGTDGVRGVANSELTVELCVALGRAVAKRMPDQRTILVGRDTRLSGPLLQAAFSAGAASAGMNVVDLGVLPTPAIATHSSVSRLPAAVVSASHNPYFDNGIKLFGSDGKKLPDEVESQLASDFQDLVAGKAQVPEVTGDAVGSLTVHPDPLSAYVMRLTQGAVFGDLGGMKVVIDCANGATSVIAPLVLEQLGADVTVINNTPDGCNINDSCGSTHPEALAGLVKQTGAAVGLAFDGDADRVIAIDEMGQVIDGDHLLAMLALDAQSRGKLVDSTVVVTVMTNLGFRIAMQEAGIAVHVTKVGDRYVAGALEKNGWSLGGEQSGHVIFPSHATTGDGLLTGLFVLDLMRREERSLSDLSKSSMTRLPQVLKNVRVQRRNLELDAQVLAGVEREETLLGGSGRVLLRPSGTEPLIRVMVEAPSLEAAEAICDRLCGIVEMRDGSEQ